MRKKFLSALLFGAVLATATGTFVSCKDYDDDIDRLDNELTEVKTKLDALQAKVDAGKYVTNITKSGEGILITWNDNSTSLIETIKGDKGDKGDAVTVTIDPTSKNWIINGEDTGICAEGKNGENGTGSAGKNGVDAKSPSIDPTTGNWVVYQWNAETQKYDATDTGISAKGANAYVVDKGNYYELNVATDKAGTSYTTVKLPKYPNTITEIEILGGVQSNDNGKYYTFVTTGAEFTYNYTYISTLDDDRKAWNKEAGVKKLAEKQLLSNLFNQNLLIRVAPASLDASEMEFTFVNSQGAAAPIKLGTPEAFNGLLTRAANENGLWKMTISGNVDGTYDNASDFTDKLQITDAHPIVFALKEKDGFTTLYEASFKYDSKKSLDAVPNKISGSNLAVAESATDATDTSVNILGQVATITFDNPGNVYDAHLHFDEADIIRWGITDISGTSFKVGKLADNITTASIPVQIHYVTMAGEVKSYYAKIKPQKTLGVNTSLSNQTLKINTDDNKNVLSYALSSMHTDLGNELAVWKADVKKATMKLYGVKDGQKKIDGASISDYGISVTYKKDNNEAEIKDATSIVVNLNKATKEAADKDHRLHLDYTYTIEIKYADENGDVLNTLVVPFNLTIPSLSEYMQKEQGVFNGTSDGKAIMNAADATVAKDNGNYKQATYSLKYAFKDFATNFENEDIDITFSIDEEQKIGDDKVTDLAELTKDNVLKLIKNNNNTKLPVAYGKAIKINVAGTYCGYKYSDDEYKANSFTLTVLSPIEQGTVTAAGSTITATPTADGTAKLKESDFSAKTYAGVAYKIFKDKFADDAKAKEKAIGWTSPYVKAVNFTSANTNVFTVASEGTAAEMGDKGAVTEGYVTINAQNVAYETTEDLKVKVTDIWGFSKNATIKVTVKP